VSEVLQLIISGFISLAIAGGVQLIFFRQTRNRFKAENSALELENKSKQAEEWRKLYEEEQGKNDDKDKLISQLYNKIDEERQKRSEAELQLAVCRGKMGFLSVIKCKRFECGNRIPPYEEIAKLAEAENEEI
jgi:uncharacterized protein HemX